MATVKDKLQYTDKLQGPAKKHASFIKKWNSNIENLLRNQTVQTVLKNLHLFSVTPKELKIFLVSFSYFIAVFVK